MKTPNLKLISVSYLLVVAILLAVLNFGRAVNAEEENLPDLYLKAMVPNGEMVEGSPMSFDFVVVKSGGPMPVGKNVLLKLDMMRFDIANAPKLEFLLSVPSEEIKDGKTVYTVPSEKINLDAGRYVVLGGIDIALKISRNGPDPRFDVIKESNETNNGQFNLDLNIAKTKPTPTRPPILNVIPDQLVDPKIGLELRIPARDPDNNPLTYSTDLEGAGFIGGTMGWIPESKIKSTQLATVKVSNGLFKVSRTFRINIDNRPIILTDNKSAQMNTPIKFKVLATDDDGETLTIRNYYLNRIQGATFANNEFSWTPKTKGTFPITFTVTDGFYTVKKSIVITVW